MTDNSEDGIYNKVGTILDLFQELYPKIDIRSILILERKLHNNKTWMTKDEGIVKISDMDLSHINNLINWLEKRSNLIKIAGEASMIYNVEQHNGGDMAHQSIEHMVDEIHEMTSIEYLSSLPLYEKLKKTAAESASS